MGGIKPEYRDVGEEGSIGPAGLPSVVVGSLLGRGLEGLGGAMWAVAVASEPPVCQCLPAIPPWREASSLFESRQLSVVLDSVQSSSGCRSCLYRSCLRRDDGRFLRKALPSKV